MIFNRLLMGKFFERTKPMNLQIGRIQTSFYRDFSKFAYIIGANTYSFYI